MGHSDSTRSWLVREQAGKGFPQVPDGLSFGLVLVHGRPEEGGLCEAEGVGQGLRLAARHKHNNSAWSRCPPASTPQHLDHRRGNSEEITEIPTGIPSRASHGIMGAHHVQPQSLGEARPNRQSKLQQICPLDLSLRLDKNWLSPIFVMSHTILHP